MSEAGALRALEARRIAGFIADAAQRWCDADFAPRVRAATAIERRLGYTTPVVDFALDRLFGGITRGAIEAAIASELGSVAALDGIVARAGAPPAWARGVDHAVIVSSDTTIGVAIPPAIFALCAKCDVVVKDRSDALVAAFFASLTEEHPAFERAAVARAWRGGDDPDEGAVLRDADVVVAFGGADALRAIRDRCSAEARFVPFGHRAGIGILTRDAAVALDAAAAERIARDALLYDGEGCLSLHALFVEAADETLARVAATLAAAFERVAVEFPGGARSPARIARVAQYRDAAAFRAASGHGTVLRASDAVLVVEPPAADAPPFLPRVLPLIPVASVDAVAAYVLAHRIPVQIVGSATADDGTVALAERIGAVRVAPFGSMQDPPLGGHHGGRPRIADFVRWIDRE